MIRHIRNTLSLIAFIISVGFVNFTFGCNSFEILDPTNLYSDLCPFENCYSDYQCTSGSCWGGNLLSLTEGTCTLVGGPFTTIFLIGILPLTVLIIGLCIFCHYRRKRRDKLQYMLIQAAVGNKSNQTNGVH